MRTSFSEMAVNALHQTVRPGNYFVKLLEQSGTKAPVRLFDRGHNSIPLHHLEGLLKSVAQGFVESPIETIRNHHEGVLLSEVTGCIASRSLCGDFREMSVDIPKNGLEAERIEAQTFEGISDYVARKGDKPEIIRQAWDNNQWFNNSGGSHRAAALWHFGQATGTDRRIYSDVETKDFSQDMRMFAFKNSIWVFGHDNPDPINDMNVMLKDFQEFGRNGTLRGMALNYIDFSNTALIVDRNAPMAETIAQRMAGKGVNLSEWIIGLNEFEFSKERFFSPEADEPRELAS